MFKMRREMSSGDGFTLVELLVTILIIGTTMLSLLGLFVSLVHSSVIAKRQAIAATLATNQMEYMKSLPFDSLAVVNGGIYSNTYIPATTTQTLNGVKYTITSSVTYADDAYDGCGSYITNISVPLRPAYCHGYPAPVGAPTDTNYKDYKVLDVIVTDPAHNHLAELNTEVAARVAESASTTGAIFAKVIDDSGNPVAGASVTLTDSNVTPVVNLGDTTDENGIAIFYSLPPDASGNHYVIAASKSGYSSLTTIGPSGTLQATYQSQNIVAQQSSFVTLTIKPQGANSLVMEATDTSGAPIVGAKIYVKGGYKKYTLTTDTTYYFDTTLPPPASNDKRVVTDSSGLGALNNLVPGPYIFCGDIGATSCVNSSNGTLYLAAVVPYGGNNGISFNPVLVPTYDASNPPSTTYSYSSLSYLQKVRLILTPSSTFPRVTTVSPSSVSLASGTPASFAFSVTGVNLPCSASPASCGTTVKLLQGSNTFTASCTGNASALKLNCTINLSTATTGATQLSLTANGSTLTIPASFTLGGINVTP